MRRTFLGLMIAVAMAGGTHIAFAADRGTREEAIAMAERTREMVAAQGLEATKAAVMDPANAAFHDRDLYVVIFDMKGVNVAHGVKPQLVGKDLIGMRDQNGVEIIRSFINVLSTAPNGWVDYKWPNPTNNVVEDKSTYVVRLDDNHLAGVGIYSN